MVALPARLSWTTRTLGRMRLSLSNVDVQYRAVEHVTVASPEALVRGLRMEKATFRQRYLYCRFDMAALSEDTLRNLEDLAIEHGDYLMPGHLFTEATLTWM